MEETFWNNLIGTPFDKISNTGQCVFTVSINLSISAFDDDDLISTVPEIDWKPGLVFLFKAKKPWRSNSPFNLTLTLSILIPAAVANAL